MKIISFTKFIKFYAKVLLLLYILSNYEVISNRNHSSLNLTKNKLTNHHLKMISKVNRIKRGRNQSLTLLNNIIQGGGFGEAGVCNVAPFNNIIKTEGIKNEIIKLFVKNWVEPAMKKSKEDLGRFCLGDFTKTQIDNSPCGAGKTNCGCNNFKLTDDEKYGLVAFNTKSSPCIGGGGVQMCFVFNYKTETYGVAFNGQLLQCFLDMAGQVEDAAVTSDIGNLAVGFSASGKFTSKVDIAYMNFGGDSIRNISPIDHNVGKIITGSVTVTGQIFVAATIGFPKFPGGEELEKYFQFKLNAQIFINYGGDVATFQEHNKAISSHSPTKGEGEGEVEAKSGDYHKQHQANCQAAMEAGAETTLTLDGKIKFKLSGLTHGFLPDMNLDLGKLTFMIAMQKNNPSGLRPGVYLYIESNMVQSLLKDILEPIISGTGNVIAKTTSEDLSKNISEDIGKVTGMDALEKDLLDWIEKQADNIKPVKLSLFAEERAKGFMFEESGWKFQCIYWSEKKDKDGEIIKKASGSCQSGNAFINATIGVGGWVISAAEKLWNGAKEGLHEVEKGAKATGKAISSGLKVTDKAINSGLNATSKDLNSGEKAVGNAYSKGVKTLKSGFKKIFGKKHRRMNKNKL